MPYGNSVNQPLGFLPSQYMNGSPWNEQTSEYPIASGYGVSLFRGDPVNLTTSGTIQIAPVGTTALLGVFWGVKYTAANGWVHIDPYWPASTVTLGATNAVALIVDDENVLFDMQVSTINNQPGPANAPQLLQSDMGRNIEFAIATAANSFNPINGVTPAANPQTGNTMTGSSAYFLDYNSIGSGATLPLKLVRFTPVPGNGPGLYFNNALVAINNHIYKGGTGTAGTH